MPLIIQMAHHSPGKVLDSNLMRAGTLLKQQGDIITLDNSSISYTGIIKLLHKRVQARSGIDAPCKRDRFLCRLVLVRNNQLILLEKGSWKAARAMLKSDSKTTLLFMFAIVPRTYSGPTTFQRLKRAWLGDGVDHQICLVEPELPMHDEVARMPRYVNLT